MGAVQNMGYLDMWLNEKRETEMLSYDSVRRGVCEMVRKRGL